jgi:hypothetical protein
LISSSAAKNVHNEGCPRLQKPPEKEYFCKNSINLVMEVEKIKKRNSKIGDIVIKKYGDKTVVSKYPDMSNIIPSGSQKEKRNRFAEAVAYAKTINNSSILRNDFLKRVGMVKSVYQSALKEFLQREF